MPFEPIRSEKLCGGSTSYRASFHRLNYGSNSGCAQARVNTANVFLFVVLSNFPRVIECLLSCKVR